MGELEWNSGRNSSRKWKTPFAICVETKHSSNITKNCDFDKRWQRKNNLRSGGAELRNEQFLASLKLEAKGHTKKLFCICKEILKLNENCSSGSGCSSRK